MFQTPDLPYAYDALEPYIDETTMKIHHDKHHATYTAKLNAAIENTAYATMGIVDLVTKYPALPVDLQGAVRNHGGGHYNHSLFWEMMGPVAGGEPSGGLARSIEAVWGNFGEFVKVFSAAAVNRFGSGWAWLAIGSAGKLEVVSTANQDNPLTEGKIPILGIDVWEHAYYLKYQNRRPEYIENFFKVVNWKRVGEFYEAAF
jgi:Fe-Mn family superoxide dismutase